MRIRHTLSLLLIVSLGVGLGWLFTATAGFQGVGGSAARQPPTASGRAGQSVTLLPDGQWLFVGGESPHGPVATAILWDPHTETLTPVPQSLQQARAWHSATVLPDGNVLLLGGIDARGQVVDGAEVFTPETQTFTTLSSTGLTARAFHTATLLTDGQVLLAGGISATGETLATAELWDPFNPQSALPIPHSLLTARRTHTAVLLADGSVLLWGGEDSDGTPLDGGELYDPETQSFLTTASVLLSPQSSSLSPQLTASVPTDGATDVSLDPLLALRFSQPLQVEAVNSTTVRLSDSQGSLAATVVAAEGGMLAFLLPQTPLHPGTTYTISLTGLADTAGTALPMTTFSFTTVPDSELNNSALRDSLKDSALRDSALRDFRAASAPDDEDWIPDANNFRGDWRSNRPDPPIRFLPPLQAEPGVTALSGQVLALNGRPLPGVTLELEGQQTQTDANGQFLLRLPDLQLSELHELVIDGREIGPGNKTYGLYEVGVELSERQTNVLPYTIWLPRIDTAHAVTIPSPTTAEVVVTTPRIPGLELHIPPNTVIRAHERQIVTEVSITAIPVDRTPYPLPANVQVPVYFTIQPGGAYVVGARKKGSGLAIKQFLC